MHKTRVVGIQHMNIQYGYIHGFANVTYESNGRTDIGLGLPD